MAKITSKNIKLKDDQKIYFGTDNDGEIYFDGTDLQIKSASSIDIKLTPGASAELVIDGMKFPTTDGAFNNELVTNGAGQMHWGPYGDRGVFGGGKVTGNVATNTIDYITINSIGNTADFGDLTLARAELSANSNGTNGRGIFGGGAGTSNVIDYITILTTGNAVDFGDLTSGRRYLAATSNGTNERGIFGGGHAGSPSNVIDYITINSIGNAADFGDLTQTRYGIAGTSNGSNERGVFASGEIPGANSNVIDYITISTTSNATDFGDLTGRRFLTGTSNGINERGVFGGGYTGPECNIIEYITINSIGNATDFGDLTIARYYLAGTSDGINERGVFGGGTGTGSSYHNVIDYITINSIGNAADFGDLTAANRESAATSNA